MDSQVNLKQDNQLTVNTKGSATTTLTITADPLQKNPFSNINEAFFLGAKHSEEQRWSFSKGDIAIDKFHSAISGFLNIFDALDSPIITEIVRKDFRWKLNGLKNSARRLRADTLRELVQNEIKSPPRFWAPSGIESLLWSHRILQFVYQLVDNMVQDVGMELKQACILAYRSTLAVRHPHMTKVIFEKALNLVPPRDRFVLNLTEEKKCDEQVLQSTFLGMKQFLNATNPYIEAITTLFDMEEIEDPHR